MEVMVEMELSVVIAIFNAEKYLRECLITIKACPLKTMECIMVNDGSTDGTKAICQEFVAKDSRFCLVDKENSGVSESRNIGMAKARGDYIFFIDADDFVDTRRWEEIVKDLMGSGYDMIAYGYYTLFESGKTQKELFPIEETGSGAVKAIDRVLLTTPLLNTCWGKLLRREVITQNNLSFRKELKTGEDTIFIIDFVEHISSVYLSSSVVLYYRQHQNSTMRRIDMNAKLDNFSEIFLRRNAHFEINPDKALKAEMYRQYFSVITNLFLQYSAQNNIHKTKKAYSKAIEKPLVKDIVKGTEGKSLSPVYKKLEYLLMKKGWCGLLAVYFKLKNKF